MHLHLTFILWSVKAERKSGPGGEEEGNPKLSVPSFLVKSTVLELKFQSPYLSPMTCCFCSPTWNSERDQHVLRLTKGRVIALSTW